MLTASPLSLSRALLRWPVPRARTLGGWLWLGTWHWDLSQIFLAGGPAATTGPIPSRASCFLAFTCALCPSLTLSSQTPSQVLVLLSVGTNPRSLALVLGVVGMAGTPALSS